MKSTRTAALIAALAMFATGLHAQEALIKKALEERLPQLGKIEQVTKSPVAGLYEVRVGADLYYADASGNFLVEGAIMDTKLHKNLTEERQQKLIAIDFDKLPLKDAFTIVRGNGKRKVAVFVDPNCGYCKKFEQDLVKVNDVTVYMFMYPILGQDSMEKARNHWCAKDKSKSWQDWMLRGIPAGTADCDATALVRNVEFGRRFKIGGTPTTFFASGTRRPGAMSLEDLQKLVGETAPS